MIILGNTVIKVLVETVENRVESLVMVTQDHAMGREEIKIKTLQDKEINLCFLKCLQAVIGLRIIGIDFMANSKDIKFNFGKFNTDISLLIKGAEIDTISDLPVSPVENKLNALSVGWDIRPNL